MRCLGTKLNTFDGDRLARCGPRSGARRPPSSGASVVELLIVVSVLSSLATISLPALQSVRESARRLQCTNNLRELGLSLQDKQDIPRRHALRDLIDRRLEAQCPSDPTGASSLALAAAVGPYRRASSDYRPTTSLRVSPTADGKTRLIRGAWWRSYSPKKITDGLSKTFAFVETAGRPLLYQALPDHHELGPRSSREVAGVNDFPRYFRHHEMGKQYSEYSGMAINRTNSAGIYAFHAGANIAMCDGVVRFMTEDVDPVIMVAHFSRAGGLHDRPRGRSPELPQDH